MNVKKKVDKKLVDYEATIAASNVLYHIDAMYPSMWRGVSASARLSIRNTMRREFKRALENIEREKKNVD